LQLKPNQKPNVPKGRQVDLQNADPVKPFDPAKLPFGMGQVWEKFAGLAGGFYATVAGGSSKMAGALMLPELSGFLSRRLAKRPALIAFELLVALILSVNFYLLVRPSCLPHADGNMMPACMFSYLSEHSNPQTKDLVQLVWKKRVLAPAMTGWLMDQVFAGATEIKLEGKFQNLFGFYYAAWLFLNFLLLMLFRKDALLIILGVFAGLMYHLTDPINGVIYFPWDMPNMFFFTLCCLMYDRRLTWALIASSFLGGLIKDTGVVCAIFILFSNHWSWRKRVTAFVGTVTATFLANKMLMNYYGIKGPEFAMNDTTTVYDWLFNSILPENLSHVFSLDLRHCMFSNVGTLLVILLLPWRNYRDVAFKAVLIVFVIGEFFYGMVREVRIWYEILPMGWMMVSETIARMGWLNPSAAGTTTTNPPAAGPEERRRAVFLGSYWLLILALFAVAVGIRIFCLLHPAVKP
jgi:hypothetical protein